MKAFLILENGTVFEGTSYGAMRDAVCEIVFNTSMTGYLEIMTDPSYAGQGVVMTFPAIGNYGICEEDGESERPWVEALIAHEFAPLASNFRNDETLEEYMIKNNIAGLQGIDTRALTKILRESGTMNGLVTVNESYDKEAVFKQIKAYQVGKAVERVTVKAPLTITGDGTYKIALMDYGYKRSIVRNLLQRGCDVTIFPSQTDAQEIIGGGFDGIMLSNGPGDPKECNVEIENIKQLFESNIPMFAICLGHQLLALATGADTKKMVYGHRGANHPVKDLEENRTYITSQNHGYVVIDESVNTEIAAVSHININDKTCEGIRYKNKPVFSVQFHPEACPGPTDTKSLFDKFIRVVNGTEK